MQRVGETFISPHTPLSQRAIMKRTEFLIFLFVFLLVFSLLQYSFSLKKPSNGTVNDVFVGVDLAYGDIAAVKSRIDEVSSYTNLVVIGSTVITYDPAKCTEVCQYAYDRGLYFMIYASDRLQQKWVEEAKSRWGDRFLGIYVWDEASGKQLDHTKDMIVNNASDPAEAERAFVSILNWGIDWVTNYSSVVLHSFSSDYALYWFDYKAGYTAVFAEFGWNYSRELNIGLVRGAATAQNKDWGVTITWTYTTPPYIESGALLYYDLKLAYDNGAKYIMVFDGNENWTQGILKAEHLQAIQQFWQYIQKTPRTSNSPSDRVAYVLPDNYAYGFRGPNDKIWGLWEANDFTTQLCTNLNSVMEQYGSRLDIIYDDPATPNSTSIYSRVVFWNGTICGE
jgi:hypothetical protein